MIFKNTINNRSDIASESTTLVDILQQRGQNQSDRTAYIFLQNGETESGSLTYGELDRQARAIAFQLQAYRGERALLLYPSGLEFISAFFGCLYAGVIAVPVYPPRRNQKLSRLLAIANNAQARLALTTTSILADVEKRWSAEPELAQLKLLATDGIAANTTEFVPQSVNPKSLAFLQYTSGSTGTPKGVMVTHRNIIHNQKMIQQAFGRYDQMPVVSWLPLFHDMGLIGHVLQPLYIGLPSILMPPEAFLMKPIRWLKAISKYQATTSGGPNFAYDLCVKKIKTEELAGLDLSSWDLAYSGAEPVRAETLEQFNSKFAPCGFNYSAFYPCYGMAETTLFTTGGNKHRQPVTKRVNAAELKFNSIVESEVANSESRVFVGVGRPYIDTQVVVVNPDSLTPCKSEQVGEIWVKGGSVASGYWNRPQATQETFQAYLKDTELDSFLRTGDLGFVSKGELFVTGRLKDLIIIRGRNYYPQDLELTVENSHPALRNYCSAAFLIELAVKEHLAIACEVERTYLRKLNVDEVVQAIKIAVSKEHELEVDRIVLLKTGSIPKTSSGKIQRRTCKLELLLDRLNVVGQWAKKNSPTPIIGSTSTSNDLDDFSQKNSKTVTEIAAWLTDKIAELLQIAPETIDSKQPLAVYGLDSVKAVSIAGELETWLGIAVTPTIVYDYPTIQALADHLGQTSTLKSSAVVSHPQTATEAIAIIGKGCRFPQANNPQAFWSLLRSGNDAITKVPASRWESNNGWGGFMSQVDRFDAQFFGISPREASNIDPQQRLLLEVSWEALENAGLATEQLTGSRGGVFIGISSGDYAKLGDNLTNTEAYYGTGNALSIAANRLSYFLDWRGPSLAVDTACSSSLVAVHQACQSLIHGECNLALAGGVNLILTPQLTLTFSEAKMMAADGRCKTFDASADGYVRGEGCGVVVLKRLQDALADGDNIQAVIRGSAVNQDGQTNGLTAPNGNSQQEVIRLALAKAGVKPDRISYVEAHGTGTSLGDPIEVNSLKAVLMQDRDLDRPCWLGSVKTNIGHLEAAAGIAGLIKVILSLEHGEIPPHLHLKQLNPYIELDRTPIEIPTQLQPWQAGLEKRLAGVSAFGFGGTNAHVVVEETPSSVNSNQLSVNSDRLVDRSHHILTLSAKCEQALQELAQGYHKFLGTNSTASIADICFTANTGRSHFNHRLALISSDKQELTDKLAKISAGEEPLGVFLSKLPSNVKTPKIAFLFTGQGSQYLDMGKELYRSQPLFKETLEQCDRFLQPYLKKSILEVIYPEDSQTLNNSLINQTAYTQPAIFATEYALYTLWQSWGIKSDVVMGHSVGEYVAACVAGVFSLEDGLKLIAHRGRLMQNLPAGGEMVSVMASLETVEQLIEPYKDRVAIAAINGSQSIVISGVTEAVKTVTEILEAEEIKTKQLQVSHAFHSPLMKPMLAEFAAIAEGVTYNPPRIPIVSNLTGSIAGENIATASHWVNHICQPVKFAQSMETLHREGYDVFLEIGAKPILLGMGRQVIDPPQPPLIRGERASAGGSKWLPSLRVDRSDWQQMLQSLAQLYVRGVKVNWSGFDNSYVRNKVSLPTYPWQRQRYWIDSAAKTSKDVLPLKDKTTSIVDWLNEGNTQQLAQQLEKLGKFDSEQVKLLPSLLETLIEQHQEQLTAATIEDWFYQVTWKHLPIKPPKTAIKPGHWLIFADTTGVGEKLAQQLRQQGCECSLVYRSDRQLKQDTYRVDPTEPKEFERIINAIAQNGKLPLQRVIHLWSLDAAISEELTTTSLSQAQVWGCGAVLHLIKALIKTQSSPKLWLITKGTQSVQSQIESVSVAASSLWGMGKVIALEHSQLWGGAIDLDSRSPELATETLLELLADSDRSEDRLALRGENIYVPRLVKQSPTVKRSLSLKSDATYLITGGLGALGLQTAAWMVEKGAKHLVLAGRKQPSAQAQETIKELQKAGAQILVLCGDISREEDVTKILSEIQTSLPTLRGVIHAAGLLDDALLHQMSWDQFTRVMLPKVQGAWHLHSLTQDLSLDLFVCFSSMASVLGSPGQGNYAAANAFMDALVRHRRATGLPGLSINWGAWADIGMASRLGNSDRRQMTDSGINLITPQQGMKALDRTISASEAQVGLFNIDWHQFEQKLPPNVKIPLLEELIPVRPVLATSNKNNFLSELKQTSVAEREKRLSNYLQNCVAQVLGMAADRIDLEQPLIGLGIDSLMAMEIRNQVQSDLEIDIPITKFMEEIDVATLIIELNEQLTQIDTQPNLVLATESKISADTYPLSYGQKALWFLWKLEPLSSAYNLTYTCRISAEINIQTLRDAWQILCDRHPLLHSIFIQGETEPVQKLVRDRKLDFEVVNASNLSHPELEQKVRSESQRPFDLENKPVIRLRLFQLATTEQILLLAIHHIAVDGLSRGILVEEFQLIYQALLSNTKPALTPLQNTYRDYVNWQRDLLTGESGTKLWQYWQAKLAGDLPVLNLPTDKPRPPVQTYNGASVRFSLSEQLTGDLKQLAKQEKVTLYTLLLAIYNVLLYRYTGQEEILVGTPTSGRTKSEFVSLVGYFVDPVVMRANLVGNPSFSDFLGQIRQTAIEALAHQDFPFALLVERLQPDRELSHSPIFQTTFDLYNLKQFASLPTFPTGEQTTAESKIEPWEIRQQEGQFDLDLEMQNDGTSLTGVFKYNTDLFNESTIARMANHLQVLLEAIAANPQQPVGQLPLLTEAERHQILIDWNDTARKYPQDKCIHQLFESQVQQNPDAVAVVFKNRQLAYQQLNRRANQLARHLETLGVELETLVGICVERSVEMVVAILGILKAGGAYIPLDPAYPQARLSYMLSDSRVEVLLTNSSLLASLPSQNLQLVCLDTDEDAIAQQSQDNLDLPFDPDNLAYIINTSGSTGVPKGVRVTHRSLVNAYFAWEEAYQLQTEARNHLQMASFSFDVFSGDLVRALCSGGKLVLCPREYLLATDKLYQLMLAQKIDCAEFVPAVVRNLIEYLEETKQDLSFMKLAIVGSDSWYVEEHERLRNLCHEQTRLINSYGVTEATVDSCYFENTSTSEMSGKLVPIGKPFPNVQVYILDSHLQAVPIGIPGELYIGGDRLARGYLNRPKLNQAKFISIPPAPLIKGGAALKDTASHKGGGIEERLYRTGDLVRYLSSGNIEFLGRIDNQVKIRGFRIELGEIESVLKTHPQVQQAVVIVIKEPSDKRLVAYLVGDRAISPQQLREFLKQKLPEYMLPSAFVTLDTLPLTPNGKVDRKALPAPDLDSAREREYIAPRTTSELQMTQIWSKILNITSIGVQDNFFELGGHSLLAVRLMSEIQRQFQKNLPLASLFQNPTIAELASLLDSPVNTTNPLLVPIKTSGKQPPLFLIHPVGGNVLCYADLASHLDRDCPVYGLQSLGWDGQQQPLTSIEEMAAHYIKAVQQVQPQGSYHLIGWSMGGVIAYEMAQQLQATNEPVALLGLIDSYAPTVIPQPSEIDRATIINQLAQDWGGIYGQELDISLEKLRNLEPDDRVKHLFKQAQQQSIFPPEIEIEQMLALWSVFQANVIADYHYQPKPYSGSILLINASESPPEVIEDSTHGWGSLILDRIQTHTITGDHYTIMRSPQVENLAATINRYLQNLQGQQQRESETRT